MAVRMSLPRPCVFLLMASGAFNQALAFIMDTLGQTEIWSFIDDSNGARRCSNEEIRISHGRTVRNYFNLAKEVAELQFRNPSHVLLFRGQCADYKDGDQTTLKPRIFRHSKGKDTPPTPEILAGRFDRLSHAEKLLAERYREDVGRLGSSYLRRYRIVRWSVLQHFEVCRTPLLDVTHSLRIAASFACPNEDVTEAFVFVLAVPQLSGAITVNIEAGLQMVRLTNVCPPSALRPHFQEGYLLGEYPDRDTFDERRPCPAEQVDFGVRLIGKFRFNPQGFWDRENFPRVQKTALYVSPKKDPIYQLTHDIWQEVNPTGTKSS